MRHANNFDLIRLIAAIQVFALHSAVWLKLSIPAMVLEVLDWFPGVPIFFMISGLLVTHSFVRLPTLFEYFRNRALRIFPGLWACLAISFIFAAWQGDLETRSLFLKTGFWLATHGSFFQFVNFYVNPGVTNGPLWSISTELQFYIVMPLLAILAGKWVKTRLQIALVLISMAIASALFHGWVAAHQTELLPARFPTFSASILANGYFFIFGVLAYLWQDALVRFCRGRFFALFGAYLLLRLALLQVGVTIDEVHTSMVGFFVYPLLGLVVFSLAHSFSGLARTVLRGHDFSYGIYIYHMPVIYLALHFKFEGIQGLLLTTLLVTSLAVASWFLIERPALRFKNTKGVAPSRREWEAVSK